MKLTDILKTAKKSDIRVIATIVCAVIFISYYFFFLSPLIAKFMFVFREVSSAHGNLDKAELSISRMPRIKREIDELSAKAGFYSNKLPKEEEFPAVLENLSDMAQNARVKITKILPIQDSGAIFAEGSSREIYRQREISIDAQCGYHQLGAFLAELESAERFMEVSDIKIEANRTNPKRHSVRLMVKTFLLHGEEQ